ncbi:DUF1810 family protein [Fluviibacterium sp. DFM31]|uniref:DUF1810 family protein n=1 Tax=Meridianimarinicoccus marinus TaxID=3231483 RepID=A0ABV3LDD7_9RHOB
MEPQRFLDAQAPVWDQVLRELSAGRKQGHWMWFVFPQLVGLGISATAQRYALEDAAAARAYAAHPVLGPRLRAALAAAMRAGTRDPVAIFGTVDAMKLRSCLTLFSEAAAAPDAFRAGIAHFYKGQPDPRTLALLRP